MYADGNNCLIAATQEPQRHFLEKSNRRGDCCFETHLSSGYNKVGFIQNG